ncbi:MAG: histone H1 [Saprospiraceae bacterium]
MKRHYQFPKWLKSSEAGVQKFNAGNNAAGGRVRKAVQDLENLAQGMRKEVLDAKNSGIAK